MQSEKEQVALDLDPRLGGPDHRQGRRRRRSPGSLAILSEAAHSLIDLVATIMTYFAVRISGKPADEEHHYGHGKVESVTALAETALLFVLSGVVIWEAAQRLFGGTDHAVEATICGLRRDRRCRSWSISSAPALLYRVAHETASEALEADALHFGSDMWSSIAVLIGLGAVALGYPWADSAAAARRRGVRLPRRLAARPAHHRHADRHRAARRRRNRRARIAAQRRRRGRGRTRAGAAGRRQAVRRDRTWRSAARCRSTASSALKRAGRRRHPRRAAAAPRSASPSRRARSTTRPSIERVMVIARNRALAVHHVTVHDIRGKLSVSLDLEVDRKLSLGAAHEIADALEAALARRTRPRRRGRNPHRAAAAGRLPAARRRRSGSRAVQDDARRRSPPKAACVRDVHNVRVRETDDGEIVNFHCRVDPALTRAGGAREGRRSRARACAAARPRSSA